MSPAGRLESHQRGFWIETLVLCPGNLLSKSSNFFQKKVVGGQPPVNDRRVGGKHNTVKQADSGLGGWMLRNFQGESLKPNTSLHFVMLPSAWPCHGWDSSRWLPTYVFSIFIIWISTRLFLFSVFLLISWLQSPSAVIWEPPKIKSFAGGQREESHPWQGHAEGSLTKCKDKIRLQGSPWNFLSMYPNNNKKNLPAFVLCFSTFLIFSGKKSTQGFSLLHLKGMFQLKPLW